MIAHQAKKMTQDALRGFRDRFQIPVSDADLVEHPLHQAADDSPEMKYLHARRAALGGYLPQRRRKSTRSRSRRWRRFERLLKDSRRARDQHDDGLRADARHAGARQGHRQARRADRPDESRTFGMEGMFRSSASGRRSGQLYKPQDADQLMYYRESKDGQVLQEGINEGGAMSSWIVAATSYSTNNVPMIPFYIYYSMFGLQRVGDLAWLAGDIRARGFLLGGTAGRTTLNGEGLQHEDGHSHILAGTDPELHLVRPDLRVRGRDDHPRRHAAHVRRAGGRVLLRHPDERELPAPRHARGQRGGHPQGPVPAQRRRQDAKKGQRVQLMGSGTILREVMAAAELLQSDFGIAADVWSATSFNELRRDGMAVERWNRLHPTEPARKSHVEHASKATTARSIAATDYMRNYADQVREQVQAAGRRYTVLGTDGFGRSDYRRSCAASSRSTAGTVPSPR
jgi:pyruvate dehydrogenase E1 component